jgi:precorrin-6B C5,15-methyltransferase / cobalt-precorrin-6B C5,C15-methyltransferase
MTPHEPTNESDRQLDQRSDTIQSGNSQSGNSQSEDSQSADIQSADIQSADIQSRDSQPPDSQTRDIQTDHIHGHIHVVGVGLSGPASLSPASSALVKSATLVIGANRHLAAFGFDPSQPSGSVACWPLGDFTQVFLRLRSHLQTHPTERTVVLASGDPLFFGVGRLLLTFFPATQLTFHPQVSAIQLAFSRLKLPWQDATLFSVHGRDEEQLLQAIRRGDHKIAVLTDGVTTPSAIAALLTALDLPIRYRMWVCENLGDSSETVSEGLPETIQGRTFAPLNVVVLLRSPTALSPSASSHPDLPTNLPDDLPTDLPIIGLPDAAFEGFPDRPTLMTKREIRLLILGALAPQNGQVIWDVGAGTGSVSIEISRLCPNAQLYAIEKTAMGAALIRRNADRLAIAPIQIIQGQAPIALQALPKPHRVFIGGSGGQLSPLLTFVAAQSPTRIVLALATLEHLAEVISWAALPEQAARWQMELTQVNVARSLPIGPYRRFSPLTPITLITLSICKPMIA